MPAFRSIDNTQPFNGPLSRTTQVSQYQKGKTNLDFTEARDSEWQWHELGHMQVCTSLQTDNHPSTAPLVFYRPDALPATQPTASKHWRSIITHSNIPIIFIKTRLWLPKQWCRSLQFYNIFVCTVTNWNTVCIKLYMQTTGWRRGVVVSGVRQWMKLTHVGPGYNWDGWPSSGGYTISGCNQPTKSTQPCIPPGSLNRVPASAGVKAGMSPLPGGR